MPRNRPAPPPLALAGAALVLLLASGAAPVRAQELYTFSVGALGGVGGSLDVDRGDALDNLGAQLDFGLVTDLRTHLVLRLGRLDLDTDEGFGPFADDSELTYATIGGEYKWRESYYTSGIYLALGGYRLEGIDFRGSEETDTAPGLALGVTGEFPLHRRVAVLVELSGHYVDFEDANLFALGHAGLAVHF
ncbi:MAG TPA: hypothetical protein VF121_01120 [Thermoanaerobaculia bacterium]|nr:hypothetical protein [Thermoanaerobaculia bacterium]